MDIPSTAFIDVGVLVRDAHRNAVEHGFWDADKSVDQDAHIPEKLMLIVSEVVEALEEYRQDGAAACRAPVRYRESDCKPEGFGIELADAVIRIADLAGYCGLDLAALIAEKHAFNRTRPRKHGKHC